MGETNPSLRRVVTTHLWQVESQVVQHGQVLGVLVLEEALELLLGVQPGRLPLGLGGELAPPGPAATAAAAADVSIAFAAANHGLRLLVSHQRPSGGALVG